MKKTMSIILSLLTFISMYSTFNAGAAEKLTDGDYEYFLYESLACITKYSGSEKDVTIPTELGGYKVNAIYYEAFKGNKTIESVTIPQTVTQIELHAFAECSNLSKVSLPETEISVTGSAFTDTAVYNDKSNWTDGVFYLDKHLITGYESTAKDLKVKSGTVQIHDMAFFNNEAVESVSIPSSVKYISTDAFS